MFLVVFVVVVVVPLLLMLHLILKRGISLGCLGALEGDNSDFRESTQHDMAGATGCHLAHSDQLLT